jgi:hypothetical protein
MLIHKFWNIKVSGFAAKACQHWTSSKIRRFFGDETIQLPLTFISLEFSIYFPAIPLVLPAHVIKNIQADYSGKTHACGSLGTFARNTHHNST